MANIFTVTEVIDGDTFKVDPNWNWNNREGNIVRPTGYNTPEVGQPGYNEATLKLRRLIEGKEVELRKAVSISFGRLVCDVYYSGKYLADYFPENQ